MDKKLVIGVVVGILIILGGVFLVNQKSNDEPVPVITTDQNSEGTTDNSNPPASETPPDTSTESSTITYSDSGFSPSSITVTAGSKVTVKNTSSSPLQFDSDPHPDHTDNPELNIGRINSGESQTITVTTKGSHGYHNHLNSSDTGTLVVN